MTACVILDVVEPGAPKPDYCIHGRTTCQSCGDWCWLGTATFEAVSSGAAWPLCKPCAARLIPPGQRPVGHLDDHRRADGPHP
jgi:hypothetical protein